jgi:hypothetical protein
MRTSIKLGAGAERGGCGDRFVGRLQCDSRAGRAHGDDDDSELLRGRGQLHQLPGKQQHQLVLARAWRLRLTSGSCNDINVKTNASRDVTVCFKRTGSCNGWHRASSGQWTVVASSVLSNTDFYVQFKGASVSSGLIAY